MVVLAASVVTKTGKGEMNEIWQKIRLFKLLLN